MKNAIIIVLAVCLGVLILYETFCIVNRERIAWIEGNFIVSPMKKWAVCLQTTSNSDPSKSFSRILLFDARRYPDIVQRNNPTRYQQNNPTASFLLPLQLYARVATMGFNAGESSVIIKQGPVNRQAPVAYTLDLNTFGLNSLDTDSSKMSISSNRMYKSLCNYWISKFKTVNGKKHEFNNTFTLNLKPDSTAETRYAPDNFHKGRWFLQGDSSFVICLKVLETFKIARITDSSLIVDTKWDDENVAIEFGMQNRATEKVSASKTGDGKDSSEMFIVYAGLYPPYKTNGTRLQEMLKAEGYESYSETEEDISMVLSEKNLRDLFHARIRYKTVAASASARMISEPFLEEFNIPVRFRKMIRSVDFDPQR